MVLRLIWLVPLAYGGCALAATATKYFFVSLLSKYPNLLPFISHSDASLFGECLFCHLASYSAFLLILTCYIRHREAVEYYGHRLEWDNSTWRLLSLILAFCGSASGFFITIIAHCEDEELRVLHSVADTMAFSFGLIYAWGQTLLSLFIIPRMCSLRVGVVRLLIAVCESLAFVVFLYARNDAMLSASWVLEASLWTVSASFHLFIVSFFVELRFAYAHAPMLLFSRPARISLTEASTTTSLD